MGSLPRTGNTLGDVMRLPVFLLGFVVAFVAAIIIGRAAGFEPIALIAFVIAVVIAVQLAYVALIALLAAEHKSKSQGSAKDKTRPAEMSGEPDA